MLDARTLIDRVLARNALTHAGLAHELQLRGYKSIDGSNISRWRSMPPDKGPSWQLTLELLEMAGWLTKDARLLVRPPQNMNGKGPR